MRTRRSEAQLAFEALTIEGGLLSPEWLARVAQLQGTGQSEADYRIPKGLNLRDEIGRYWRIAQALYTEFAAGKKAGADPQALAERFVLPLLRDSFGFSSILKTPPLTVAERLYPIGHHALDGQVPIVVAPGASGLDTLDAAFGDGARRRSAFGLAQEYLNAEDKALWGVASDGVTLRILRDNASLTRPAWIEADLGRIFSEERYADFAALWLLAHETRFGAAGQKPQDCPLERWRSQGREEGTRAREHLRDGVEEALLALGNGFLAHSENQALHKALQDGTLSREQYFQQLLRLVYRIIFLLTVEERAVLHPDGASATAKQRYEAGYSLRRLRNRSVKRSAHDRFGDLWEGLKVVLRGVARGEERLGLPALGGLFGEDQCPQLDAARLENRALLTAIFRLSWMRNDGSLSRVNWRDMGPEELGSVYESLLELVPQIASGGRAFSFATGDETKGNARKTTGSYYTPDTLVQALLDSALEPVIATTVAANPQDPVQALLSLSIVDPACGSGHFLLAAARRLAAHVARLRANGTPSAAQYRAALREVVGHCLFGVDLNPMAVELCRVSLWMEAVEPGRPLSFLDSHIQHGNALLGATPDLLAEGIPDAAWEPVEGDDKKTANLLKKRNKAAKGGQRGLDLFKRPAEGDAEEVTRAVRELEGAPDTDLPGVEAKRQTWRRVQGSTAYANQRFVANTWCAAFVWPKPAMDGPERVPVVDAAPTDDVFRQIRDGVQKPPAVMVETVESLAAQGHFFHWHLAFPHVFKRGGFDLILGNPPWEQSELKEKEWFAEIRPDIAQARTSAERKRLIENIRSDNPALFERFSSAKRAHDGQPAFLAKSGAYPLCGTGRINLYSVFAERVASIARPGGRLGMVLPTGIATDDTNKDFFSALMNRRCLVSLFDFENKKLFTSVHSSFKFCLLTATTEEKGPTHPSFVFFAHTVEDLSQNDRLFSLSATTLKLLNPNTATCPVFRSKRDSEIVIRIHQAFPVLLRSEKDSDINPWGIRIRRLFNMGLTEVALLAKPSAHGNPPIDGYAPMWEGKMLDAFNHRAASVHFVAGHLQRGAQALASTETELEDPNYLPQALYEFPLDHMKGKDTSIAAGRWQISFKDVTATTNERTIVAAVLPWIPTNFSIRVLQILNPPFRVSPAVLLAWLNSFAVDYVIRQKLGGLHVSDFITHQLPIPAPVIFTARCEWDDRTTPALWITERVIELSVTSFDLIDFAVDMGSRKQVFRWSPVRRAVARAELDAAFFHLYGLSREDTAYVMDTFPIVRKNDEKAHGEYRTKRVILEIYDAMTDAARSGKPYQTRLDPPPADPRVAHPARSTRRVS